MNKKENLFITSLRLNLNNAQDMEAWNNLMSADSTHPEYSSYCRTIVTAINDHFTRQDRMEEQQEWETALLKKIESTIRETLTNCLQGLQITTPQPTAEKSEPPAQPDPPDEMEERIVAFLDNF